MTLTAHAKSTIIREARKDWADLQQTIQDWNDMADECQRQGYRPKYCIHGTSSWTDYDNICAGCEDGIYPQDTTYTDVLRNTLASYRSAHERFQSKAEDFNNLAKALRALGVSDSLSSDTLIASMNEVLGRFI